MPSKEYYATHKEQYATYYQDNKTELLAKAKQVRKNHPELMRKKNEKYLQNHREDYNAYQRKYQKGHRGYHTKWRRERNRELKKWVVDKLGRKCVDCGLVSEFDCVYDFHHEDRTKSWSKHIKGYGQARSNQIRVKEFIKWQKANKIPEDIRLLCSNWKR